MNSFLASSGSSGSNRMAVSYLFGVILRSCLLSADRAPGRFAGSKEYVSPRGVRRGRATLVFLARLRVPARHGLVEAQPRDVGERLAGGGDRRVERPPEPGGRGGQDVVGRIDPRGGPSDPHADPQEIGRPETLIQGAQAVVTAGPAAALEPHRAERQVEVVVEDHQI